MPQKIQKTNGKLVDILTALIIAIAVSVAYFIANNYLFSRDVTWPASFFFGIILVLCFKLIEPRIEAYLIKKINK